MVTEIIVGKTAPPVPTSILLGSGYDLRTQTVCITSVVGTSNAKILYFKRKQWDGRPHPYPHQRVKVEVSPTT